MRPGFTSPERILSIRTARPDKIDRTSLSLKCSWPLKDMDMGAFAGSAAVVIARKMLAGSDRSGGSSADDRHHHERCPIPRKLSANNLLASP